MKDRLVAENSENNNSKGRKLDNKKSTILKPSVSPSKTAANQYEKQKGKAKTTVMENADPSNKEHNNVQSDLLRKMDDDQTNTFQKSKEIHVENADPINKEHNNVEPDLLMEMDADDDTTTTPQKYNKKIHVEGNKEVENQTESECVDCALNDDNSSKEVIHDGTYVGTLVFNGNSKILEHDSYNWKLKGKKKATKLLTEYSCKIENCNATKFAKRVGHYQLRKLYEWIVDYRIPHTCANKPLLLKNLKKDKQNESPLFNPIDTNTNKNCVNKGSTLDTAGQSIDKVCTSQTILGAENTSLNFSTYEAVDDEKLCNEMLDDENIENECLVQRDCPIEQNKKTNSKEYSVVYTDFNTDKLETANVQIDPDPSQFIDKEDIENHKESSSKNDDNSVLDTDYNTDEIEMINVQTDSVPSQLTDNNSGDIENQKKSSSNNDDNISLFDASFSSNQISEQDDDSKDSDSDKCEDMDMDGVINVEFPVGNTLRKYKLIQLSKQPKIDGKGIIAEADIAVIVCNRERNFKERGHFDCFNWGKMSKGKLKKKNIGSYNCTEKSKGCTASKRKWICSGICEFSNNFCCDYSIPDFDSLVSLYTNKHSHNPKETNLVKIQDIRDANSDIETQSPWNSPVSSTPIRSSNEQHVPPDSETSSLLNEDEIIQNVTSSSELGARLRSSFTNPNFFCYKTSAIKITAISKIKADEMSDTFHIIQKSQDLRAFDACKDGFEYKRGKTRKMFPNLFPNQQVHKYECYGRLKCVNHECPIFRRLSTLSYASNKANTSKKCSHCSNNLVEDHCSGSKFIMHSHASTFAVVYYSVSHSCGNQDWVIDPAVIEQLTALFETNDSATSAVAYKKLFEEKLRIALNDKNKESQNAHIEDLISVVNSCAQDHVVKNVKSKVIKAKTPLGRGIEAVKLLNDSSSLIYDKLGVIIRVVIDSFACATCQKISYSSEEDEEMLTECCNNAMVNTGPVILVTSKDNLKSAMELSTDGGIFSASTVHVDHQPARCKTMDTLNVAFYDHNLREMSSVFMTHSMGENQFNVLFEFKLFEIVSKEHYGNSAKFDPFGFTSDNAGGITAGIKLCFGPLKPHRTCRFHIIYCGYQHCGTSIGTKKDQILFLRFLFSLIDASTATLFVEIAEKFWKWIRELPSRTKQLENWWDFWFNCRAMWSSAFTNQTLTEVSLVESLQSKYSKKNNLKKLPLYQSVVFGMSDLTKYSARLLELGKGKYIGQGPSKANLDERDMMKQLEKVKSVPLTDEDFKDIFKKLGLPYDPNEDECTVESESVDTDVFVSPITREKSERHRVLANFTPSPIAKHTFKKPPLPKSSEKEKKAKKPGRPPKSKTKTYVSRFSRELDLDFCDGDEYDPTVVMDDDFVAASNTLPDEIIFNMNEVDKVSGNLHKQRSQMPSKSSSRKRKSKFDLSSIFSEEESVLGTQLMDENHVPASETFDGEIVFNLDHDKNPKESQMNEDVNLLNSEWEKNDSEEEWLGSIDWNETIFSQGTMNELMDDEIFDESNVSVSTAVHCAPRKKTRARDSIHYKKQKCKAFQEQDFYEIQKLSEDCFQVKDKNEKKNGNKGLALNNVKIVTFNFYEKEVNCTCKAWKTEKLYKTKADEVCKHVPLVVLKCDKKQSDLYHGNRSLAEKDIHKLTLILKTFDAERRIENEDAPNETTQKAARRRGEEGDKYLTKKTLLKLENVGPFSTKEVALASAPPNSWYGELYSVGGNPGCRTCSKKINVKGAPEHEKVVIRTDVAYSFLPPIPNSQYILKVETIRFCLNNFCHKNLPRKAYRSVHPMAEISLKFLPNEFHLKFQEAFQNASVAIVY